jgi:hypothetical protein
MPANLTSAGPQWARQTAWRRCRSTQQIRRRFVRRLAIGPQPGLAAAPRVPHLAGEFLASCGSWFVAPQEEAKARLRLNGALICTRDVDQLQNIVRLVEEDRPGIEELSQAVRPSPSEAVGEPGLEVVGEHVSSICCGDTWPCNRSKYRSIVSITIGSSIGVPLTSITFRRPYSVEVPGRAAEDVGTLLGGEILQAGEHQFVEGAEVAGQALDGEVASDHATLRAE